MKKLTRVLVLFLSVLMLLGAVACGKNTGDDSSTTTAASADTNAPDEETTSLYDKDGYLLSNLPDLDFGGEKITVLYWSDVEMPEYESEQLDGTLVNDAIFTRNSNTEKRLNVKLSFVKTAGNGSHIQDFVDFVGKDYKAGDKSFDLISSYSRTTALCAMEGYCEDLSALPYLDFPNPWWPASLLDIVPINDRIYFASGDASINVLHFMYSVYINKDLINNFGLEDPIKLVDEDKWTIEKLQEMCTGVYLDLNGDGKKGLEDRLGFTTVNYGLDAFYTGSGLRLVDQENGKMIISPDFFSEKADALCTTLTKWVQTSDVYMGSSYSKPFVSGNAIFCQNRCYLADRELQNVEFVYSIVPTPKYDNNQEDFISVVGNPFSLYGIYSESKQPEHAAAVLESWAAEAYRTTTPAQFELNMKSRYSESSDESRMYDIIRSTVCFDLGRLFNPKLNNITDIYFKAVENGSSWNIAQKAHKVLLGKLMDQLNDSFDAIASK